MKRLRTIGLVGGVVAVAAVLLAVRALWHGFGESGPPERWFYVQNGYRFPGQDAEPGPPGTGERSQVVVLEFRPSEGKLKSLVADFRQDDGATGDSRGAALVDPAPELQFDTFELKHDSQGDLLVRRGVLERRYRIVAGHLFQPGPLELRLESFEPIATEPKLLTPAVAAAQEELSLGAVGVFTPMQLDPGDTHRLVDLDQ